MSSFRLEGCTNSPQWLQTTLSDLSEKMKAIQELMRDGNITQRHSIAGMVEEFNQSYHCIADYDHLRNKTADVSDFRSSSSLNIMEFQNHRNGGRNSDGLDLKDTNQIPEFTVEDPDADLDQAKSTNAFANGLKPIKSRNMEFKVIDHHMEGNFTNINGDKRNVVNGPELGADKVGRNSVSKSEAEKMWSILRFQVTKLIEENKLQQSELIRRNDEKRDKIKQLEIQLAQLKGRYRPHQDCIRCSKSKMKQSRIGLPSKILRKLFNVFS